MKKIFFVSCGLLLLLGAFSCATLGPKPLEPLKFSDSKDFTSEPFDINAKEWQINWEYQSGRKEVAHLCPLRISGRGQGQLDRDGEGPCLRCQRQHIPLQGERQVLYQSPGQEPCQLAGGGRASRNQRADGLAGYLCWKLRYDHKAFQDSEERVQN